jgi:hypothetical protein
MKDMYRTILFCFVWFASLCTGVFDSWSQQSEIRMIQPFHKVRVSNNINVTLVPGKENKAELSTKNIMNEKVLINVFNDELLIKTDGVFSNADVNIIVYYTEPIKKITTTFGGLVRSDSVLKSEKLELECKLDGFANLLLDVNELKITAGQGADVYINGKSKMTIIEANTGANVRTEKLVTEDADVKSILRATVWVNVKNNFKAHAVSGGKIYYSVQPSGDFKKSWSTGGEILQQ